MSTAPRQHSQSRAPGSITDVAGIRVGHFTDLEAATGCTVVLCEGGAAAGVDVRGASPGTRETDLLRPTCAVERVQAVLLGGGSAFGLGAAQGVVDHLARRGIGHEAAGALVPIVPAAILFDLALGSAAAPGPEQARRACEAASAERPAEGTAGAGTGATVAKVLGPGRAVKGGVGTAAMRTGDGAAVGALVATNAVGGVYDPWTGRPIAGPQTPEGSMECAERAVLSPEWAPPHRAAGASTTIGVVATDAPLSAAQASRLASAAHDGLALAVRPAHTVHDGDTFFALATGADAGGVEPARLDAIAAAAAVCVAEAIARSVLTATGLAGVPALGDPGGPGEVRTDGMG